MPTQMLQERLLKPGLRRKQWSVDALTDVSLTVRRREWLGLYGHNGSGKTTLLRILAGVMRPDSGSVRRVGRISCFFGLGVGFHPERRAEENIRLHGLLHGVPMEEIERTIPSVIRFAGIESHLEVPIKCYSTGMQMRLAYAAAAHIEADTYLMDEVLAVGDVQFQQQCWEHLHSMKRAGKTVILVSHDRKQIVNMCDRMITLDQGRVIAEEVCKPPVLSVQSMPMAAHA